MERDQIGRNSVLRWTDRQTDREKSARVELRFAAKKHSTWWLGCYLAGLGIETQVFQFLILSPASLISLLNHYRLKYDIEHIKLQK